MLKPGCGVECRAVPRAGSRETEQIRNLWSSDFSKHSSLLANTLVTAVAIDLGSCFVEFSFSSPRIEETYVCNSSSGVETIAAPCDCCAVALQYAFFLPVHPAVALGANTTVSLAVAVVKHCLQRQAVRRRGVYQARVPNTRSEDLIDNLRL